MNDSFKTMLAFIGGAAAGVALGILLAPDKGSETRKKILSKAKDLGDDLSDAAMDKYDEFLSWKDSMLNSAEEKAKTVMNETLSKAESKIKNSHV